MLSATPTLFLIASGRLQVKPGWQLFIGPGLPNLGSDEQHPHRKYDVLVQVTVLSCMCSRPYYRPEQSNVCADKAYSEKELKEEDRLTSPYAADSRPREYSSDSK